jgi:cytochrome c-type biogenesis protein CcmH
MAGSHMKKLMILLLAMLPLTASLPAQDIYNFVNPKEQARFAQLTSELRCLVCQNQNLAESNAPLANDLRNQIYQQVQAGNTNKQIIDYLVARYGSYVLYKPPFNGVTLALWLGPFLIFIFAMLFLFYYLKHSKRDSNHDMAI